MGDTVVDMHRGGKGRRYCILVGSTRHEIGPGKVLTGMVNRTIKNVNCFSINSIADIKKLNDEFKR